MEIVYILLNLYALYIGSKLVGTSVKNEILIWVTTNNISSVNLIDPAHYNILYSLYITQSSRIVSVKYNTD